MVSLVLVSHSKALAQATLKLVRAMAGDDVRIAVAAGAGEDGNDLGTDAMAILEAITNVMSDDGVVVLMDMGSAVLSAEMALDFLDDADKAKIWLSSAPFVEGAVAAGVSAKIGGSMKEVAHEASASLSQKMTHINPEPETAMPTEVSDMDGSESVRVLIRMPSGLHARPVSKLVQEAAKYKSEIHIKDITSGKGPVSIKSMTGIIALEALKGHTVEITAKGEDQSKALKELGAAIEAGLGDPIEDISMDDDSATVTNISLKTEIPIGVCKGIVYAPIFRPTVSSPIIPPLNADNPDDEIRKLRDALAATAFQLKEKAAEISHTATKSDGEIFLAQAVMLDDPQLTGKAEMLIIENKVPAIRAWLDAVGGIIDGYRSLSNEILRQKALDLQDVSNLVLLHLGIDVGSSFEMASPGILLTDDITPGQVASLDTSKVLGVICMENGPTSHSSILLRSRSIPAIVQAQHFKPSLSDVQDSTYVAFDGTTGEIWIDPKGEELAMIKKRRSEWEEQAEAEKRESSEDTYTADGVRIEVFANVGSVADSVSAVSNGAEGIGLLRTEFLFLNRTNAPSEDEQVAQLNAIVEPMQGRPVIIRTLDAGGDKALPYLDMPTEANPFLGVRAIRLTLRKPDLFQTQLRAILRVAYKHDIRIMFPMISTIDELRQAKDALRKAHESLAAENIEHGWPVVTGMMMEVPSAAIMAEEFAREVDFVSIGTNDLVQYTMAVDRGNPALQQPPKGRFDPAVTTLIENICRACEKHGIPVAVCGESASDKGLATILLGLGVTELSMNPGSIPEIKYWLRRNSLAEMKKAKN